MFPKAALAAIYEEVGFARSLLAYELPDGRLKLIDGHLRRDFDPDQEVDVEVLDVSEEDARKLLLTIDPLASLAEQQQQIRQRLMDITPVGSVDLEAVWRAAADSLLETPHDGWGKGAESIPEQYMIPVCRNEAEQVRLLQQFLGDGLECKALLT